MTKITLGAIGVLTLLLLASGWLIKGLYEDVGQLEQANAQLAVSLQDSKLENENLRVEQDRREQAVLNAKRSRDNAMKSRDEIQKQLSEALRNDPWADGRVPDAVIDSLQTGVSPDKN